MKAKNDGKIRAKSRKKPPKNITIYKLFMIDFNQLSPEKSPSLWQGIANIDITLSALGLDLQKHSPPNLTGCHNSEDESENEAEQNEWLIGLFNQLFLHLNTTLVHAQEVGKCEPEYLPPKLGEINNSNEPAKICFAHGYFASALHEISHWTIAGRDRRTLIDFGYWYAPDGRSELQQQAFEKVEIKPQAIECLLTLACGRIFRVSQDNLFASFDTSHSTFEEDVYQLTYDFLQQPDTLPRDARILIAVLFTLVQV